MEATETREGWGTARVRAAVGADRPAVEGLLSAAGLPVEGLADQFPAGYAVAEAEGAVVGAAGVEVYGAHGLLRSVVVAAERRGEGLGERLVADRLRWAGERGVEGVWLLTTTAAGFFPRLGFRAVVREAVPAALRGSPEFASVCPASAAVLALRLTGGASGVE